MKAIQVSLLRNGKRGVYGVQLHTNQPWATFNIPIGDAASVAEALLRAAAPRCPAPHGSGVCAEELPCRTHPPSAEVTAPPPQDVC